MAGGFTTDDVGTMAFCELMELRRGESRLLRHKPGKVVSKWLFRMICDYLSLALAKISLIRLEGLRGGILRLSIYMQVPYALFNCYVLRARLLGMLFISVGQQTDSHTYWPSMVLQLARYLLSKRVHSSLIQDSTEQCPEISHTRSPETPCMPNPTSPCSRYLSSHALVFVSRDAPRACVATLKGRHLL